MRRVVRRIGGLCRGVVRGGVAQRSLPCLAEHAFGENICGNHLPRGSDASSIAQPSKWAIYNILKEFACELTSSWPLACVEGRFPAGVFGSIPRDLCIRSLCLESLFLSTTQFIFPH